MCGFLSMTRHPCILPPHSEGEATQAAKDAPSSGEKFPGNNRLALEQGGASGEAESSPHTSGVVFELADATGVGR